MKVLIIHNKYLSRHVGGEDIVYQNELNLLQQKLGKDNVFSYEVSNDDINKFKLLFSLWFSFEHYKKIKKIVLEQQIELVHIHNFFPLLTPSAFKAAKDAGAKVIHTLHNYRLWCISGLFYKDSTGICEACTKDSFSFSGIVNKCYRKSLLQSILAQLTFWFYKSIKIFDTIDCFIVLTNFQKQKVMSLGIDEQRLALKPNSMEIAKYSDISSEQIAKKEHYIYVGRLEESKGIDVLLATWALLDERFVLSIIGGGDADREALLQKKYQSKNIIFKGKCTRETTLSAISKAKYLIQPSILYETFGLTIIEAMSFATPVIAFNIGTRIDLIEDGINGFISDPENLHQVIEQSIDYQNYKELSQNALLKAQEFDNDRIMDMQIELYKKVIG